jgi:G3E family GTPase
MTPPLTILTGFLGSGKTTLLQALLAGGAGGRRLALVVNEFGQVGLDGAALARAGAVPLVELAGGCVCCEAGSDLLLAVEELLDYEPDQIVIETSGLAEPGGVIRRARGAGLDLDAVVAVADALNLGAALAASPVAEWQLRAADIIVLSKVDLVTPEARATAEAQLRALNPRAAIIPAANGHVPADLLFGPRLGDGPLPAPDHRAGDGFTSLEWISDTPLRRVALEEVLRALPPQVYRAKGLVHCTDAPWPDELQAVCGRHSLTAVRLREPARPLNRLVLLGQSLSEAAPRIIAALDTCPDTPERAAAWWERYQELW